MGRVAGHTLCHCRYDTNVSLGTGDYALALVGVVGTDITSKAGRVGVAARGTVSETGIRVKEIGFS
jgi:hypothetical protein